LATLERIELTIAGALVLYFVSTLYSAHVALFCAVAWLVLLGVSFVIGERNRGRLFDEIRNA
jgi:hypothetical protein